MAAAPVRPSGGLNELSGERQANQDSPQIHRDEDRRRGKDGVRRSLALATGVGVTVTSGGFPRGA